MFDKIVDQLKEIKATAGAIQKTKLVAQFIQDEDFKKIIVLMLDPFITFGVSNLDRLPVVANVPEWGEKDFYLVFNQLARRELTGYAALYALSHLWSAGVDPWLMNNICNKQTGCGFGVASVNKASPKLIRTFPYMRCSRPNEVKNYPFKWEEGVFVEFKEDGMFVNLDVELYGVVSMRTRQGTPLPIEKFPHIVEAAKELLRHGTQTHGELIVYKNAVLMNRQEGNGLINSVIEGGSFEQDEFVAYVAWDQIPLHCVVPKGKCLTPYYERFAPLQTLGYSGHIVCIEHIVAYSPEEAKAYKKKILLAGGEGTVKKHRKMIWEDKTSKYQVKEKVEAECDLKIVGYRPGKGKNVDLFGAIICRSSDDLLEAAVGISSMSEKIAEYVHKNREALLGTIVHVLFNTITEPSPSNNLHSLFLPRMDELRKDKLVADSLPEIKSAYQATLEAD